MISELQIIFSFIIVIILCHTTNYGSIILQYCKLYGLEFHLSFTGHLNSQYHMQFADLNGAKPNRFVLLINGTLTTGPLIAQGK